MSRRNEKVIFRLEADEDGFPPVAFESLVATQISDGIFRLDNSPFFVRAISYGSMVHATPSEGQGTYEFEQVVAGSDFTSISIILLDRAVDDVLKNLFKASDCIIEYGEFGKLRMFAVAIPPEGNYSGIRERLVSLEENGQLSFAELGLPEPGTS